LTKNTTCSKSHGTVPLRECKRQGVKILKYMVGFTYLDITSFAVDAVLSIDHQLKGEKNHCEKCRYWIEKEE
jgi:hypothetical protein